GLARGLIVTTLALAIIVALPLPEPISAAVRDSLIGERLATRGEYVQRALSGVFGDAVQQSIGLLTVHPESSERVDLPFRAASPTIDATTEARMLELLNRERTANGLQPLVMDDAIRQVA